MISAGLGHNPGHPIEMACWISDEGAEDAQQSDSRLHLFLDTTVTCSTLHSTMVYSTHIRQTEIVVLKTIYLRLNPSRTYEKKATKHYIIILQTTCKSGLMIFAGQGFLVRRP